MSAKVNVLLIEDDELDAKAAQRALSLHPEVGEVHRVSDGETAITWLKNASAEKNQVGMVLLDLGLPKRSGLEVLRAIKSDTSLAHLPVVILSDNSNPDALLEVYRRGACAFLRKSGSAEGYRRTLEGVLRFWQLASWQPKTA